MSVKGLMITCSTSLRIKDYFAFRVFVWNTDSESERPKPGLVTWK